MEASEKLAIDIKRTQEHFKEVVIRDGVKFGSKQYFEWQRMYFCGAMTMINCHVNYWAICMAANRPIIEKY